MHQISLLNGLGDHVLRPDRVYATGVLAPMAGFRPGEAVMSTAQRFTQGPYTGLRGLGDGGGAFGKLKLWWQGVKARASVRAQQVQARVQAQLPSTAGSATVSTNVPKGNAYGWHKQHSVAPMAAYGESFGPAAHLPHALTSRAYGQSPSLPAYAADAAAKTTMMQWRGLRWPWG
jgi:hypothetical protein